MKKILGIFALAAIAALFSTSSASAQGADTTFHPGGKVWMQMFADYDYMLSADTANNLSKVPTGKTYYVPIDPKNANNQGSIWQKFYQEFDIRRFYLGYDYNISRDVSAQMLLSHETGILVNDTVLTTGTTAKYDSVKKTVTVVPGKTIVIPTASSGDILLDANNGLFLKAANVQFKNWWMNSNVIIGQQSTAAFGVAEAVWGYRSIEKTIADMRSIAQSSDLGIMAKGSFDQPGLYNYSLLISNGNGSKGASNKYKKFSLDLNGWFLDKKIVVELYGDYIDKAAVVGPTTIIVGTDTTKASNYDQSNMTIKATAGYMSDPISAGVEYVMQTQKGQSAIVAGGNADLSGLSIFAHGTILQKQLSWFARYDMYDPDTKATGSNVTNTIAASWKESFITAGLDWQPSSDANAHIMPNIWMDTYSDKSSNATARQGVTVARLTFAYKF